MADKKYRPIPADVQDIIDKHQIWLQNDLDGIRANLSYAHLNGADLSGANLFGANLFSANLSGANLSEADLSSANLSSANLSGADLFRTNLNNADLHDTYFIGAHLNYANLSNADLSGANLFGADLHDANLHRVNLEGANVNKTILEKQETKVLNNAIENQKLTLQSQQDKDEIDALQQKLKTLEKDSAEHNKAQQQIETLHQNITATDTKLAEITNEKQNLEATVAVYKEALTNKIDNAVKALSTSLTNSDTQITKLSRTNLVFGVTGFIILVGLICAVVYFITTVLVTPQRIFTTELVTLLNDVKQSAIIFFSFPLLLVFLAGSTLLKQYRHNLLEIRHYSQMKHQIELYSGLLKAAQHTASNINDIEKAEKYVEETFTKIRNKLLETEQPDSEITTEKEDVLTSDNLKTLAQLIKNISPK